MNLLILLLRFVSSPGGIAGMLVALLVTLLWVLGPRFGIDGQLRTLVAAGLVLIGVIVALLLARRNRRRAEQVEQSLIMEADASVETAGAEQKRSREAARGELMAALAALKKSRVAGGRGVSALPWYLVLGRAEAGKSSLIRGSGLQVPGEKPGEIRGIGASRHCDWWFTNQAVLLEAHRRFADIETAQSAEADWTAFLNQLRKVRARVPLNGVVLAVPAEDLIRPDASRLEEQARLLRKRLDELTAGLQVVCPVYLAVTRVDCVHGFAESFADLEGAARHQILGATIGAGLMEHEAADKVVDQEFQLLYRTLGKRRLPCLVREDDPAAKSGIFLFPLEFHALREPLLRFVKTLCAPDAYGFRPPLRGFYFTCGGGGGETVDVVLDEVSRVVGLPGTPGAAGYPPPVAAPGAGAPRRPFFLKGFFLNVLIPDFRIARPTARAARREWWLQLGLRAAGFAILGLLAFFLVASFGRNLGLIRGTRELAHQARQVDLATRNVGDVEAGLAGLEPLRQRLVQLDGWDRRRGPTLGMGLYRGGALNTRARDIYLDRLVAVLLAPSHEKLELELRRDYPSSQEEYTAFYDRYRVYRMLVQPQQGDPELVAAQLQELWAREAARGQATPRLRDLIGDHVGFAWWHVDGLRLHCRRLPDVDRSLADKANRYIRDYWKPEYFYRLLLAEVDATAPPYTLDRPGGGGILVTDPRVLDAGGEPALVPGSFTLAGWRDGMKGRILGSERQLREDWLLAEAFGDRPPDIRGRLLEMYARDYVAAWVAFLGAVDIAEQPGVQAAADRLDDLARPGSALLRLVEDARANLRLAGTVERGEREQLAPVLRIEESFAVVRDFDAKEERDGESYRPDEAFVENLHAVVGKLAELNQASEPAVSAAAFTRAVFERALADESAIGRAHAFARLYCRKPGREGSQPCKEAFEVLLQRPARAAWRACLTETEHHLDALWESQVYAAYGRLLRGKYPFTEGGPDAAVSDFADFFGPEGALPRFVRQELSPYLDQDLAPREVYGTALRLGEDARQQLLRAAAFGEALFRDSPDLPGVKFDLRPSQVVRISGQVPYDAHSRVRVGNVRAMDTMGQQSWTSFTWPTDPESVPASVAVLTDGPAPESIEVSSSAWAIFRLLDRAEVTALRDREYEVTWVLRRPGDYEVRVPYTLRAQAAANPFAPGFFAFHCGVQLSR